MKKDIFVISYDNGHSIFLREKLNDLGDYGIHNVDIDNLPVLFNINATRPHAFIIILKTELNFDGSIISYIKGNFAQTPIIALSDTDNVSFQVACLRAGAQFFLVEGRFSTSELKEVLLFAEEEMTAVIKKENDFSDYKQHFHNSPISMWIVDAVTLKFLLVNKAAVENYGYSEEEFYAMNVLQIRPSEDIEIVVQNINARHEQNFDAGIWTHTRKNGKKFYVHIYSHSTKFNGKNARLCYAVDVNDKILAKKKNKLLSKQLKEQKDQLDDILGSIGEAICSRDANTLDLVYGNKAYYNLLGVDSDQGVNDKNLFFQSIHPEDLNIVFDTIQQAKTVGNAQNTFRYYHKDNGLRTFKFDVTLKKGANGNPDILNGAIFDFSKEKELYDIIKNNEQKLKTTINNTNDYIWSVNTKLELIFCNKAYQELIFNSFGIEIYEGCHVLGDWYSEHYINIRRIEYERALSGESFTTVVTDFQGDSEFFYEINTTPIKDHEGKIIGVNCISRDVTELKRRIEIIKKQNEKLIKIAWMQSHKVRGPVASILGLIPLFNYEVPEENIKILGMLEDAAKDLDLIINEIVRSTYGIETPK